jgi:hypothetical protein
VIDFDVNQFLGFQQLHGNERRYTLFHDETNNTRKLLLSEKGLFNAPELHNFVLGGIALEPGQTLPDLNSLRTRLSIQKTATEIKFRHVATGALPNILSSRKLSEFLGWLNEHQICIHYQNINVLYWSLVDIVDSVIGDNPGDWMMANPMKTELHRIVKWAPKQFREMLGHFGYPSIDLSRSQEFVQAVGAFVARFPPRIPTIPSMRLRDLLERAHQVEELPLLHGGERGALIESFRDFFLYPLLLFKNSDHFFDHELVVERLLSEYRVVDGDRPVSYRFSDSKAEAGIQLSDVVVGMLGKLFIYIENTSAKQILADRASFDVPQRAVLEQLRVLMDKSEAMSNAFRHAVTALDSHAKATLLLDGPEEVPRWLWDHGT